MGNGKRMWDSGAGLTDDVRKGLSIWRGDDVQYWLSELDYSIGSTSKINKESKSASCLR